MQADRKAAADPDAEDPADINDEEYQAVKEAFAPVLMCTAGDRDKEEIWKDVHKFLLS